MHQRTIGRAHSAFILFVNALLFSIFLPFFICHIAFNIEQTDVIFGRTVLNILYEFTFEIVFETSI